MLNFGKKLASSFTGALISILIFLGSFGVLYWNEGKVNMANIARQAQEISATQTANSEFDQKLVYLSGDLTAEGQLGDQFLVDGDYLAIQRSVEMFAWQEKSKSNKNEDGSSSTNYEYEKVWTKTPSDSSKFKIYENHYNPSMAVQANHLRLDQAKIGNYTVNLNETDNNNIKTLALPSLQNLSLNEGNVKLAENQAALQTITTENTTQAEAATEQNIEQVTTTETQTSTETAQVTATTSTNNDNFTYSSTTVVTGNEPTQSNTQTITTQETEQVEKPLRLEIVDQKYIFLGKGTLNQPEIGDLKITYQVLPNPSNSVTVFGKLDLANQSIKSFKDEKGNHLFRIFRGDQAAAIDTMQGEHNMFTWFMRILGFMMMWIGLRGVLGPISTLISIVPILGDIGNAGINIITFVTALVLTIVTIIVSMIIHNIFALIAVGIIGLGGLVLYLKNRNSKLETKTTNQ